MKLLRYTTTYELDGVPKSVVYYRAQRAEDEPLAEKRNDEATADIDAYQDACETSIATNVKTEIEEVD